MLLAHKTNYFRFSLISESVFILFNGTNSSISDNKQLKKSDVVASHGHGFSDRSNESLSALGENAVSPKQVLTLSFQ